METKALTDLKKRVHKEIVEMSFTNHSSGVQRQYSFQEKSAWYQQVMLT